MAYAVISREYASVFFATREGIASLAAIWCEVRYCIVICAKLLGDGLSSG